MRVLRLTHVLKQSNSVVSRSGLCWMVNGRDTIRPTISSPHYRRRFSTKGPILVAHSTDSELDSDTNFGTYDVILPPEPYIFGTSHISPPPRYASVPAGIPRPPYILERFRRLQAGVKEEELDDDGKLEWEGDGDGRIRLGGDEEGRLRSTAKLAKEVRDFAASLVKVGTTTNVIDESIHEFILAREAYPSPLLYKGFPRSICTSVNNVIAHGIPDDRPLESGDIINIDITIYKDGHHGDTSKTFCIGDVDRQGLRLVHTTTEALEVGIEACGPGRPFKDIGKAIYAFAAQHDFSVNPQFTGHGIGRVFHRPPWIVHTMNEEPGIMQPGDCFTIEPCLVQGSNPLGWIFPDGWTASTENCARSAQEEHMILITETGVDILTR